MSIASTTNQVWALNQLLLEALEKCRASKAKIRRAREAEERRTKIWQHLVFPFNGRPMYMIFYQGELLSETGAGTPYPWAKAPKKESDFD